MHELHAAEEEIDAFDPKDGDDDYDYKTSTRRRIRLRPDDLPDAIQSALTGPDLHLTRGLEHAVLGDDDSLPNHVEDDEGHMGSSSSSTSTTSASPEPPAATPGTTSTTTPSSMLMATTTTMAATTQPVDHQHPSFTNIRGVHDKPDFTSNAVDDHNAVDDGL